MPLTTMSLDICFLDLIKLNYNISYNLAILMIDACMLVHSFLEYFEKALLGKLHTNVALYNIKETVIDYIY